MSKETASSPDQLDTAATVRIDRRQRVFAQIEAAILCDKLVVTEPTAESAGSDPYNTSSASLTGWNKAS